MTCRTLLRHTNKKGKHKLPFFKNGAGKESRTLDLNLGKVALYQLSYSRNVCILLQQDLNYSTKFLYIT